MADEKIVDPRKKVRLVYIAPIPVGTAVALCTFLTTFFPAFSAVTTNAWQKSQDMQGGVLTTGEILTSFFAIAFGALLWAVMGFFLGYVAVILFNSLLRFVGGIRLELVEE